jgi:hypothetical protein
MLSATRTAAIALALVLPNMSFAAASQPADPFASEVEQKCTDAASNVFRRPVVAVDPTGTQSYGVAIVYGRSKELKGPAAVVCVVDRKTGKVEVGSPLGKDVVRVRKPKPEGADDKQKPRNNRKQQTQNDQQSQPNQGNAGGQDDDDGGDDQQ